MRTRRSKESSRPHYINFEVRDTDAQDRAPQAKPRRWKLDDQNYHLDIKVGLLLTWWTGDSAIFLMAANVTQRANAVEDSITMACDFALKRNASRLSGKTPTHWWNAEISLKHGECVRAKREKEGGVRDCTVDSTAE